MQFLIKALWKSGFMIFALCTADKINQPEVWKFRPFFVIQLEKEFASLILKSCSQS